MPRIEYAIDIWDLAGTDGRPDANQLQRHLLEFGDEGWELATTCFNVDLARHGPSHLLVFKRGATVERGEADRAASTRGVGSRPPSSR